MDNPRTALGVGDGIESEGALEAFFLSLSSVHVGWDSQDLFWLFLKKNISNETWEFVWACVYSTSLYHRNNN